MAMKRGYKALLADAEQEISRLSVAEVQALLQDDNTVLVDIRDIRELRKLGKIPGAVHAPRGMLEFWIDPESPYHREVFAQDKRYVFFCAAGMRSVLATKTAQDMGLEPVADMVGGFGAWVEAGGPVDLPEAKG